VGDANWAFSRIASVFSLAMHRSLLSAHASSFRPGRTDRVMKTTKCFVELTCFDHGIIRRKVTQLILRAGFRSQDRSDLEQELAMRVVHALQQYESEKAHRNAYVTAVVERSVADILRRRRAEKRASHRSVPMQFYVTATDDPNTVHVDQVKDQHRNIHRGVDQRSAQEQTELEIDLRTVLNSLPEDLRTMAEQLMSKTASDAARDMGMPRQTFVDRIRQLRLIFESAGLRDYLR
jgi:RNA polymerase sigma factor (sigma-70 family)